MRGQIGDDEYSHQSNEGDDGTQVRSGFPWDLALLGLGLGFAFGVKGPGGVLSVLASIASQELSEAFGMKNPFESMGALKGVDTSSYQTSIREAKVMADLLSTETDLQHAHRYVAESLKLDNNNENIMVPALFSAAHISYRRAFNRGKGGLGKSDIKLLGGNAAEIHTYHYSQADKLVAHSVNAFDTVKIGAIVESGEVNKFEFRTFRMVGLSKDDNQKFLAHIDLLNNKALQPRLQLAAELLMEALRRIPVEQIVRAPKLFFDKPDKSAAGKSR